MDREYAVKCDRALTEVMRAELRDVGLAIMYETELGWVYVRAMMAEVDESRVRELAFVERVSDSVTGRLI